MADAVSDEQSRYDFIRYTPGDPAPAFFENLIAARLQADAFQSEVLGFIEGRPPYEGAFVATPADLSGPVGAFPRLASALRRAAETPGIWRKTAQDDLNALLAEHGQAVGYFASEDYRQAIDRTWQSYLALVAARSLDRGLLAELASTLWLAHVIDQVATPGPSSAEGLIVKALSPAEITRLTLATIVLPSEIFPRPATPSSQDE